MFPNQIHLCNLQIFPLSSAPDLGLLPVDSRFALMMEAARTSETLVNFYQTTRCYNPEDSHLYTHRRENLKSYSVGSLLYVV
jgi:hypothetical protein